MELTNQLRSAIKAKDADQAENALNAIRNEIPSDIIPAKDKDQLKKAEELIKKLRNESKSANPGMQFKT